MKITKIIAVLSTTVLPLDGTYSVTTLSSCPEIFGVPHYVGHPDTKALVEELGAVPAPSKLFPGLQPGESALCFPIRQGRSTRVNEGFTSPHQTVTLEDLSIRVITRIDGQNICPFCGTDALGGWCCPGCGAS